jgi:hypothetical protein
VADAVIEALKNLLENVGHAGGKMRTEFPFFVPQDPNY